MKRSTKEIAEETLDIIKQGFYLVDDKKIDVQLTIQNSVNSTCTIPADEWHQILSNSIDNKFNTEIEFTDTTTIIL